MQDVLQEIAALKEQQTRVQRMRNDADAAEKVASTQLDQIDKELTRLGINPDNAEVEVAALEQQLHQTVAQLKQQLTDEELALTAKLDAARAAGILR